METGMTLQTLMDSVNLAEVAKNATIRPLYEPSDLELCRAGQDMINDGYLPYDQNTFKKLAVWLARWQAGKKHGLLLSGGTGSGKTYFVKKCLSKIRTFNVASDYVRGWKSNAGKIDAGFWADVTGITFGESWTRHIVIDDLGQEPTANNYGNVCEVLEEVINQRYLDWQKERAVTVITSNLTADKIQKRYGDRVFDRLREMCDLIEFNGQSLRGVK